ncbi:MAG: hypothetical protein K0R18_79 [Bacillales bacterium]|nr:hypothetical protein [Bacillales bacterium]
MHLDALAVMSEFDEQMSFEADAIGANIRFQPISGFSVYIKFNIYQKRLELDFGRWQNKFNVSEIIEFIEKRNGLMMARDTSSHNSLYSLKYSERNCQRLIKILNSLFTEYFAEKRRELSAI